MPIRFLSEEWAAELKMRLNESEGFRKAAAGAGAASRKAAEREEAGESAKRPA